jgi:hypothetical protein
MPDLGNRASALGPQPIEKPLAPPPAMFAAARHILDLLAAVRREASKRGELEALAMPKALDDLRELIEAVGRNTYERHEIVAHAKVNAHYYVKGRLLGQGAEPFAPGRASGALDDLGSCQSVRRPHRLDPLTTRVHQRD